MLLALLAGCAALLGRPQVEYAIASPVPLLHTSVDSRRWYLPVEVEGHGGWVWFFDTGYSRTTCDDGLVQALGLRSRGRARVKGELGSLWLRKARLPPMTLGGHTVRGLVCHTRDLASTSSIRDPDEVRVAGVLGMDALARFQLHVDPGRGELWLRGPDERTPLDRDAPDTVRMRREFGIGPRVKVPLQIGAHTLRPILDTGASGTHLDLARLGRSPTWVREGVVVRGTGRGNSAERTLSYYVVEDATLAAQAVDRVTVTGRERRGGLLGLDLLAHYVATYDFASRVARFRPTRARDLPTWSAWRADHPQAAGMRLRAPLLEPGPP